ncbi:MAG: G8 domain-containing protein, partial [Deltaproteobacteria bacterium]|nr:G8 domain-containing protein [Nannocystaceae bacterium]
GGNGSTGSEAGNDGAGTSDDAGSTTITTTPSEGGSGSVDESDGGDSEESSGGIVPPEDCVLGSECTSWCDPASWGGAVPDASTDVVVADGMVVLVDCDAAAGSITIAPGGELRGSREHSATLTSHGNIVVHGVLDYGRPDERIPAHVTAEIVFADLDDAAMAGSPSTVFGQDFGPSADTEVVVLESDVGLWVEQAGVFTAAGAEARAWSFIVDGVAPGDTELEVEDASGWRVGDRIALTPTAPTSEPDFVSQFDEATIAAIDGNRITLAAAPTFTHAGCTECTRRGEAIDLTRNVVVRSADDTAHAHILAKDEGMIGLDSVELRWLGPEYPEPVCGAPFRRHPLHFHQQDDRNLDSYVRHVSIHGGQHGFISVERTDSVEIVDVAGYDTYGFGMVIGYDPSACGTRCTDLEVAPEDIVMTDMIAARVGAHLRAEGCARISHRLPGIISTGDEHSGCSGCVATGIGVDSSGSDISGFQWAEGGSGRPIDYVFENNIAHNNNGHGSFVWHNGSESDHVYRDSSMWSNAGYGVLHGAYGNSFSWSNLVSVDNLNAGMGLKSIPDTAVTKIDGAVLDAVYVLPYVLIQEHAQVMRNIEFSGDHSPAVTQFEDACGGNPDDPLDPECSRVLLRFENVSFPAGTIPFWMGNAVNNHTVWEIRGFTHPDYPDLPADFDLYRRDYQVEGGQSMPEFDAWLVPR